jgi:hypothetical protein
MSAIATAVVHVKLSSKVKELAPKVPMRLNECNARKIYEIPRGRAARAPCAGSSIVHN